VFIPLLGLVGCCLGRNRTVVLRCDGICCISSVCYWSSGRCMTRDEYLERLVYIRRTYISYASVDARTADRELCLYL